LGFVTPLMAIMISFCFLGLMLYKRVNLGITLTATAIILALLALPWETIPTVIYNTTSDLIAISIVLSTFEIMLLSQLYNEAGFIKRLSESLGKIIKNPKIVASVLPAVIGFLQVGGGALMSAPLVDSETGKIKLKTEKRAYVNLWFRHTIFPVYPLNQVLIVTAALTGITVYAMILRQIPAAVVMIVAGYLIGFWKVSNPAKENTKTKDALESKFKEFFTAFSPILTAIVAAVALDLAGFNLARQGFDVLIAILAGIIVLVVVSKIDLQAFVKPFKSWGLYGVTLAAYGAFLLKGVMTATGISEIFQAYALNENINIILLLTAIPGILGFLTGSVSGGIALSISILSGILHNFTSGTATLIHMSCYLGYLIAPTHLCFAFTADYFKCSLSKIYKYLIPSFLITFATSILTYYMLN